MACDLEQALLAGVDVLVREPEPPQFHGEGSGMGFTIHGCWRSTTAPFEWMAIVLVPFVLGMLRDDPAPVTLRLDPRPPLRLAQT